MHTRKVLASIAAAVAAIARKAITGGPDGWLDEELIILALALVTVGLWPRFGQQALVAPGIVLLWLVLPQRHAFFAGSSDRLERRKG